MVTNARVFMVAVAGLAASLAACTPGYMKAGDLDRLNQGPNDCARSCYEIGMHMTALVLVSNQLPGCVCQPNLAPLVPNSAPLVPNTAPPAVSENAAAAAVSGEVVVAAAAAAAHQRQAQQQVYRAPNK